MDKLFENSDAVFIASPSNLFYFTGYANEDARIVLTPKEKYYISDMRVKEEVQERLPDWTFVDITGKTSYDAAAKSLLSDLKVKKLGIEKSSILLDTAEAIKRFGMRFVPVDTEIMDKRAVKSESELKKIIAAQEITDKVFSEVLENTKAGMTEIEMASFINSRIYSYGGTLAFDTIAAFGKNTSKPHAHPSEAKLKANDVITIDFGAKYEGYCSDMTRSFAIGEVTAEYRECYENVLASQDAAINGLKADISGIDGDALARNYLKEKGIAEYFTHSLGHSLGVFIHESPNLSPRYKGTVPENAVTSVEPGVYFDGKFGIRIEDIVVFKKNKVENLTKSPKSLIII